MEKAEVIESLKHNTVPNEFERIVIYDILENKRTLLNNIMTIVKIFNFGKQCGIRRERILKKRSNINANKYHEGIY